MGNGPKNAIERIQHITKQWETLRPTKSFAGLTLEQFKEAVKPAHDVRAEIGEHESRLQSALARRVPIDVAALEIAQSVVDAVKSDRTEGPDGDFYAALGYVRKSARSSGLTRKRENDEPESEGEATQS